MRCARPRGSSPAPQDSRTHRRTTRRTLERLARKAWSRSDRAASNKRRLKRRDIRVRVRRHAVRRSLRRVGESYIVREVAAVPFQVIDILWDPIGSKVASGRQKRGPWPHCGHIGESDVTIITAGPSTTNRRPHACVTSGGKRRPVLLDGLDRHRPGPGTGFRAGHDHDDDLECDREPTLTRSVSGSTSRLGIDYWVNGNTASGTGSPYTSSLVDNRPTGTDIIALSHMGTQTLEFSEAIATPVFAFVSLNGNWAMRSTGFRDPDVGGVDGNACGYSGCGWPSRRSSLTSAWPVRVPLNSTNGVVPRPHGTIRFTGAFDSVTWRSSSNEFWNGFTVGVQGRPTIAL